MPYSAPPPSLAALATYPSLLATVESALSEQQRAITEYRRWVEGRRATLRQLDQALIEMRQGVLLLEGAVGSGVSALLADMAATHRCAFWFCDVALQSGASALAAQVIALEGATLPLVPPGIGHDPLVWDRLLNEVSSRWAGPSSLLLVVDLPTPRVQPLQPFPPLLPTTIPANMVLLVGAAPQTPLPLIPSRRIVLPTTGAELEADLVRMLYATACPHDWVAPLVAAAQGSLLYLRFALGLLQAGRLDSLHLPLGLAALHAAWWATLAAPARRLALMLAAAGEPLPFALITELLGAEVPSAVEALGPLVLPTATATQPALAFVHAASADYLATNAAAAVEALHGEFTDLVRAEAGTLPREIDDYLARQYARHTTYAPPAQRATQRVTDRTWIRAQERRSGTLIEAANDVAWELRVASTAVGETATPLMAIERLIHAAAIAGTLASLARTLSPKVAVESLEMARERFGREGGLKRVLELVEQLPDGSVKANVLRQIGEACYSAGMRNSAMRLLSRALDLEDKRLPQSWRDQREELLEVLANEAIASGEVEIAHAIAARITHRERCGALMATVVHYLVTQGKLVYARTIAEAIAHESRGAWARAEVALAFARAGDLTTAEALLATNEVETAVAWAQVEMACDEAIRDEAAALARIVRLPKAHLRDRGLAQLAEALALADKDGDALDAAGRIADVEIRINTLLNLRLRLEGLVAMMALEQATRAIGSVKGDMRVPLLTTLAVAYATLGRDEKALESMAQLAEGEERTRARSRVAVAFARQGNYEQAEAVARSLSDDDERDWALDELARLLAQHGHWAKAESLTSEIVATEQRDHTHADLSIARARANEPLAALRLALLVTIPTERTRAIVLTIPALVTGGQIQALLRLIAPPTGESPFSPSESARYRVALVGALAEQGDITQATTFAKQITRPIDQSRAFLTIARHVAPQQSALACTALSQGLGNLPHGREETYRLLQLAAPTLRQLGGATLLARVAEVLEEVDEV